METNMFGRPLPPFCPIFLQLYCDTSALYFLPILSNAILWFLPGLTAVHSFNSFKTLSSNVFLLYRFGLKSQFLILKSWQVEILSRVHRCSCQRDPLAGPSTLYLVQAPPAPVYLFQQFDKKMALS